jgi:hypothetical protein
MYPHARKMILVCCVETAENPAGIAGHGSLVLSAMHTVKSW